jgi:hypothetical protein
MVLDLENLDNTLKLFDPTYCVEAIRPFRPPKTWSNRGRNEPDHSLGSEASGRVDDPAAWPDRFSWSGPWIKTTKSRDSTKCLSVR